MVFWIVVAVVLAVVLGLAALSDRRRRGQVRIDMGSQGLRDAKNLAYEQHRPTSRDLGLPPGGGL